MKIVIETPMSQLTTEKQEEVWQLSHNNEVYEKDINGTLWRIMDLANNDKTDNILIKVNDPKRKEANGGDEGIPTSV